MMIKPFRSFPLFILVFCLTYFLGFKLYNYFYSRPLMINKKNSMLKIHPAAQSKRFSQETVRILVVSGGGVSGILPLIYLNYMEQQAHQPISQLFDLFSGTSTGAIIVSALNIPDAQGHPQFSAANILDFYLKFAKNVIQEHLSRKIFTLNGQIGPKYDVHDLNHQMRAIINPQIHVNHLLNNVMLMVFNIDIAKTQFIKNWEHPNAFSNYNLADILTAACAAPMFFSSVQLNNFEGENSENFMDNAMIANNPFPYVLFQAITLYPNAKKFLVVYLDTGNLKIKTLDLSKYSYNQWGKIQWAPLLMQILYESQKKQIHQGINNLLLLLPKNKFSYHYFGLNEHLNPFDVSDQNIDNIKTQAKQALQKNKSHLDKLVKELLAINKKTQESPLTYLK